MTLFNLVLHDEHLNILFLHFIHFWKIFSQFFWLSHLHFIKYWFAQFEFVLNVKLWKWGYQTYEKTSIDPTWSPVIKLAFGSHTIYLSFTPSSSMSNVVFSISVVFDRRSESGGCFLFLENYLVKFAMSQYFTPFTDDQPCQPCSYAIVNCILWC